MTIRKITVSLPEDVCQIIEERRLGRPFSQSLSDLVRSGAVREPDITPGMNQSYSTDISHLNDAVNTLTKTVDLIMSRLDRVDSDLHCALEKINRWDEEKSAEPIIPSMTISQLSTIPEGAAPEVIPGMTITTEQDDAGEQGQKESSDAVIVVIPKHAGQKKRQSIGPSSDRVPVTPEVIAKMKSLRDSGMSNIQIASILGSDRKQYISDILSGGTKSISKRQYEALMKI